MRGIIWLAMLVAILSATSSSAQEAGSTPPSPLEPLILQLGHKDYRIREAAGKQLEARGEQALPILRKSLSQSDPEIRRRLAVLMQKIERQVLLSPKLITLDVDKRPFKEVIDEVARQSGYRIHLENQVMQNVTLKVKDVTFWEVMDRLCLEGGLVIGGDDGDNTLRLFQQDTYSPFIAYTGPFRIMATNMHSNRTVNLAFLPRRAIENQQPPEGLTFTFQINGEPKSSLLGIGMPILTKAEDQNGQTLMFKEDDPNNPYRVGYAPQNYYRATQMQSQLSLTRPSRQSTRAKMIAAKLPVMILAEARPEVTVENILKVKNAKYHGQTVDVDVESVADNNGDVQITLSIRRLGKNVVQDDNWANSVFQRLELTDAKGKRFPSQGINNFINSSPAHIQAVFQFGKQADLGPPAKLVYHHWVMMNHEIEFEFKDMPLP